MEKANIDALHAEYAMIDIVCDPTIRDEVHQYFSSCGVSFGEIPCLSMQITSKHAICFELVKKGWEAAKAIMGLFNHLKSNDIEIEMFCASNGRLEGITRVKLRKSDDVEKCQALLEKCYVVCVNKKEPEQSDE